MSKSRKKVRFAVVGLGHIAQNAVLPAFRHASGNCELRAFVSGDRVKLKQLMKRYDVPIGVAYGGYDDLLASGEIDAVYIALPNSEHLDFALRAAGAGIHVLCEKPMALSAADCETMIDACERARVQLMIAYRLHFQKANLEAVRLAKLGRIGDPRIFNAVFSYPARPGNIRVQAALGGGPEWDIGIYCINAARFLFREEPSEVFAYSGNSGKAKYAEIHETIGVVMKFSRGRIAQFTASFGSGTVGYWSLVGEKGDICMDNAFEYHGDMRWWLTVRERTTERTFKPTDQFAPELIKFADCVLKGKKVEPSGWEGLADVRIIEAIRQSIDEHRPVRLMPFNRAKRPEPADELTRPKVGQPKLVRVKEAGEEAA